MSTETIERPVQAAPVVALTPPQRAAVALNTAEYEIKLRELLTNSINILAVTNKAGREECHSAYMVLKNTRCSITNLSEEATEDAKAFTKAVKAEAIRLIAITTAEEDRLLALRDGWDAAEQARKDALIAAERARVENIDRIIGALVAIPVSYSMATAAGLADVIAEYDGWTVGVEGVEFEEFADKAAAAVAASLVTLRDMLTAKQQSEAAALAAEQARLAEVARLEAERAENARVAAENARVTAEQAAEAKRLAEVAAQQQAAILAQQKEAEARAQAERDAHAKVAEEIKRQMEAQQAAIAEQSRKLAEQQAAADARDAAAAAETKARLAAALAKQQDAQRLNDDHSPALLMNAEFDAAREAERVRLQDLAAQHVADERPMLNPSAAWPAKAVDAQVSLIDQADALDELDPTNEDITAMGAECGMTEAQWVERLDLYVKWARSEHQEVVA